VETAEHAAVAAKLADAMGDFAVDLFVAALILVAAAALGSVLVEPAPTAPGRPPPGEEEQPEPRAPLQRASS
jgi:hypothetical protein